MSKGLMPPRFVGGSDNLRGVGLVEISCSYGMAGFCERFDMFPQTAEIEAVAHLQLLEQRR